ncbi:class I SAM-dependent methyltransferase [Kribbella sp. NPDC058245]|uniref:class I SAM-dependent methyltransferase n=1 Tax=Kribbella sp. NPDC058245 TaxID=3346399 RepID=UPI0036E92238
MRPDHYDSFAASYATENESSLMNAYYERPAMLALAGDVSGRSVLDAGCGSGALSAELQARGAVVTSFDGSPGMVELARERLGPDAVVDVADLTKPLPYADAQFDDAIASLVLHYFEDWTTPLAELRRVLKPGGRLLVSVNHPIIYRLLKPTANYFETVPHTEEYAFNGQPAELTYWHRPLTAMSDAFAEAGFTVSSFTEPPFSTDTPPELLAENLRDKTHFLCFIFFVLSAPSPA